MGGGTRQGARSREEVVLGFSESPEFITGSHGDLVEYMRGLGGDDRVAGGTGDNILFGGWRSDTFVFNASQDGSHAVVGLEARDMIELQQFSFLGGAEDPSKFGARPKEWVVHEVVSVVAAIAHRPVCVPN